MFGFIIFLILVVIAAIIALIWGYVYWHDYGRSPSREYISFSKFIELYNLSPEYWMLEDDYVKFLRGAWDYDIYCFQYLDFWKYRWWLAKKSVEEDEIKKKEEKIRLENRIKDMEDIIKGNKE